MPITQFDSFFSSIASALKSLAHAIAPAGTAAFDAVAWLSLAFYLLFAVVALHYAFKTWSDKVMLASIVGGTAASFVLHLSLLNSPSYAGEGALWKFVSLSQYLPWAVICLGGVYLLYRVCTQWLKARH